MNEEEMKGICSVIQDEVLYSEIDRKREDFISSKEDHNVYLNLYTKFIDHDKYLFRFKD